jgi:hypothetical protein
MMRRANIGVNHQPGASDSVCIRQSSEVRWRFQRYSPFRIALASSAIRRARGRRGYFPELSTSSTRRFSVPKPRLSGRAARGRYRVARALVAAPARGSGIALAAGLDCLRHTAGLESPDEMTAPPGFFPRRPSFDWDDRPPAPRGWGFSRAMPDFSAPVVRTT